MAIYKPTYCYPYGGSVDFCVDPDTKAIYLQCKLNTSNKKVTGYKLTLTDSSGNDIWSPDYISSISDIYNFDYGDNKTEDHGDGFNGSVLIAPLVQNFSIVRDTTNGYFTQNCLYANIDLLVDYYFVATKNPANMTMNEINNLAEVKDWNNSFNDSRLLPVGTRFLIAWADTSDDTYYKIWVLTHTGLSPLPGELQGPYKNVYIKYGTTYHDTVQRLVAINRESADYKDWLLYISSYSAAKSGLFCFEPLHLTLTSEYSWKITLYQGNLQSPLVQTAEDLYLGTYPDGSIIASGYWTMVHWNFSEDYDINQYDILITQGQILGSTGSRLQIYPADAILQKKYVQLGQAEFNDQGYITDWTPVGVRANIEIYDSTYGHIYPQEGKFEEDILETNENNINACMVYKYSNDPSEVLTSDQVAAATPSTLSVGEATNIIFYLFNGGLTTIDDYELKDGDLVLLKDLTGFEYLHGIYAVSSSTSWKRSGSYNNWANFLGKIILVQNGTQNTNHNFQSQAQVTGTIGTITGSGINAVHPEAANFIVGKYTSSGTEKYGVFQYEKTTGGWFCSLETAVSSFTTNLLPLITGQYIIYVEENLVGSTTTASLPAVYYVPENATIIDLPSGATGTGCTLVRSIGVGDINFITDIYSGAPGFLRLSTSGTNFLWNVDDLSSSEKGSELFFIPEQGMVLYPNYENLSSKPSFSLINLIKTGSLDTTAPYITRYKLYNFDWFGTTPGVSTLSFSGDLEVDGYGLDKPAPYNLGVGDTFLGQATRYTNPTNWERDLFELYGNPQYLCAYNSSNLRTVMDVPPLITAYNLSSHLISGGNFYYTPNESSTFSISPANTLVLEFKKSGNIYTYYLAIYGFKRVKGAIPVNYDDYNPEIVIGWNYLLTRTVVASVVSGDKLKLVNTGLSGPVTMAYIGSNNRFETATTAGDPAGYYIGQYTINSRSGNNYTLRFTPVYDSTTGTTSVPNSLFKPEKGLVFGGMGVMLGGTYANPYIQYGITNKVALLNINNEDVTYIKPSVNIKPHQYMVFTEVDSAPRKIIDFDSKLNRVVFNKLDGKVKLYSATSSATLVNAPYNSTNTWRWQWENNTYGYTAIAPKVGDSVYSSSSLTTVTALITNTEGIVYSSVENKETKTPYKYKIMSYFKESDYNATTYDGKGEIGFCDVYTGEYSYSNIVTSTEGDKVFLLDNTAYIVTIESEITFSRYQSCQLLRGYYKQSGGKRWEYYRMVIFDSTGTVVLQDTGNIYDGDFSQYFWGLQPTISTGNYSRYCLMIVEDEFGQIYTTAAKLIFQGGSGATQCSNYSVRYNYNLQSFDIILSGMNDGYNYSLFRKEENTEEYELVEKSFTNTTQWSIRDYNITNNRKYFYYLNQDGSGRLLLNIAGTSPILAGGKCWSITELMPTDMPSGLKDTPTIKKRYLVDENSVWLFKYNGEFGSQTQNIAKAEQTTLGQYPRIGQGLRNNETGSVSALLGSEIIQGVLNEGAVTKRGYQERLRTAQYSSGTTPSRQLTSSNDSIDMLNAWREFVLSKNPKLLKDSKGQSWIVQITSNQNTPTMHVKGQPDTISFSWTQVEDTKDIIIVGSIDRTLRNDY